MTVRSMTGFGSAEVNLRQYLCRCEIRGVNSRYLELSFRLPRGHLAVEGTLATKAKAVVERGKLELNFDLRNTGTQGAVSKLNRDVYSGYALALREAAELWRAQGLSLNTEGSLHDALQLMRLPGVFADNELPSSNADTVAVLQQSCEQALTIFMREREREGALLAEGLRSLLAELSEHRSALSAQIEQIRKLSAETYRKRLERLMQDVVGSSGSHIAWDEPRMLQELAILLDKNDVAEELTRLAVHTEAFGAALDKGGPVGRQLDFLCQELHREVNTISSKVQQHELAHRTMDMKQCVERLRQQVQNLE